MAAIEEKENVEERCCSRRRSTDSNTTGPRFAAIGNRPTALPPARPARASHPSVDFLVSLTNGSATMIGDAEHGHDEAGRMAVDVDGGEIHFGLYRVLHLAAVV